MCIGKRQRGPLLLFSSLRLKKEGKAIEKMCPNRSYRQAGTPRAAPPESGEKLTARACGRQAQADPKGLLHYNSPPNLGGVARSAGVVRLFGILKG